MLLGPVGTAYAAGRWKVDIQVPDNYPMAPPTVRFLTRCCHPNVAFQVRCNMLRYFTFVFSARVKGRFILRFGRGFESSLATVARDHEEEEEKEKEG